MMVSVRTIKFVSKILLITMTCELVAPTISFALSSGPSQPEVSSFEPVGTTDMVDLFTGDFVYNIPLLDIDGYPINISYHGGIDMEQEASWVGLGWNINPGVIGRSMRGLPDDMNGETISKVVNIKKEKTITGGINAGMEILGVAEPFIDLDLNFAANVSHSNYRGYSVGFNLGLNASAGYKAFKPANAGLNIGVNSASGADIDYSGGLSLTSSWAHQSDVGVGISYTRGQGYNTRSAAKDKYESVSGRITSGGRKLLSGGVTKTIPVGINNVVPVITNKSTMTMYRGQLKLGMELFNTFSYGGISAMYSELEHDKNGDAKGYGYLYAENANDESIHDFTRDKDGNFNETMPYLPLASMTYDIYSVSGQGTGGSFRPFRNDLGTVFDPVLQSNSDEYSATLEVGGGNLLELGGDYTETKTEMKSGPWKSYHRAFTKKEIGSNYESYYFKTAGELTATNSILNSLDAIDGKTAASFPVKIQKNPKERVARGNLMTFFTNQEASIAGVASMRRLESYSSNAGIQNGPSYIERNGTHRRPHQIGEIVQNQTDGTRYIYGIPALNNQQEELVFAVNSTININGLVPHSSNDASENNNNGRDNFFSKTTTPSYAHSFLLTSVLSNDYVDIKGDGPTEDDFGTYTKFNYSRKNANYQWKAPYQEGMAQYNPGLKSDQNDDKGTLIKGVKEIWMLHSVESKNSIAEFYISGRKDAFGVGADDSSYQLDSIVLFNKNDRIQNLSNAIPIKTIIFQYNYELCPNTPNSKASNGGKLTLKRIFTRYGKSDKGLLSPYEFNYNETSNFPYNVATKNRWGGYKPNNSQRPNHEFPFVDWFDDNQDLYASAWHLTNIQLPSGGSINVEYESDDYAMVQNKPAMDVYYFEGLGSSPDFSGSSNLYTSKTAPNLYFYFRRNKNKEHTGKNIAANYLGGNKQLLVNVEIDIAKGKYEAVRGYAEIESAGFCNNDPNSDFGYIKVKSVTTEKGNKKAVLNPITYQALNFARYYLPETLYGSRSGTTLGDLKEALKELITIFKNPIISMVDAQKAQKVKLANSYMRLNNVAQAKKGGGHRVKRMLFDNNWQSMSDPNNYDESYGKEYHYSISNNGRAISSGVASYEPALGSDDNPFKEPFPYRTQSGSNFPPNDAIGLYQEAPIGESLYPSPQVGYSQVTVTSIHKNQAASSQTIEINEFYTAAEFPINVKSTQIDSKESKQSSWNSQEVTLTGNQGYTLVFNDMHGKLKKTEKRIAKPGTNESELVSYQKYNYFQLGSAIPVMEFDKQTNKFIKLNKVLGQEIDITLDSREKIQESDASTHVANLNLAIWGVVPIPLYIGTPIIPATHEYVFNSFNSIVATKVVQQYGILSHIESFNEGALTVVKNEVFNSFTGQPLITSVNNEYNDIENTTAIPAYLAYPSMGPSYQNIGYQDFFKKVSIKGYQALLPAGKTIHNYKAGDELLLNYNDNGVNKNTTVWVMGFIDSSGFTNNMVSIEDIFECSENMSNVDSASWTGIELRDTLIEIDLSKYGGMFVVVQPRYANWGGLDRDISNVSVKNIRSAFKNNLQQPLANYSSLEYPFYDGDTLKDKLTKALSASVTEYSNRNLAVLERYDSTVHSDFDTLNPYLSGVRSFYAPHIQYAYMQKRQYGNLNRYDGVFSLNLPWEVIYEPYLYDDIDTSLYCFSHSDGYKIKYHIYGTFSRPNTGDQYLRLNTNIDNHWIKSSYVTKRSAHGMDLEELSAIGVYSAAAFGFNNSQPIGVANNARQNEVLFEGFEDYALMQRNLNLVYMSSSMIGKLLSKQLIGPLNNYNKNNLTSNVNFDVVNNLAHSGNYSLKLKQDYNISLPVVPLSDTTNVINGRFNNIMLFSNKKYVVSLWYRPTTISNATSYSAPPNFTNIGNIIEGWQKAEYVISLPARGTINIQLPAGYYVDDLRISPQTSSTKSFVYNVWNNRLMATLDENNFATFYEYDLEGKLLRTKKETEKGIMTINESRSAHPSKK